MNNYTRLIRKTANHLYLQDCMTRFAHDSVVPDSLSGQSKKEQVADMFDNIAYRYDFLNRFLSAGLDISWRRKALKFLEQLQPKKYTGCCNRYSRCGYYGIRFVETRNNKGD
jgi:hypothetical protein